MLGFSPSSPLAFARHLLDYPLIDSPYDFDQLPLPVHTTTPSPPPRPARPDASDTHCVSPKPVRAYGPSWISHHEPSDDKDIEMSPQSKDDEPIPGPREPPSTPKSSIRSTRGNAIHCFSPVTPSRLSLPPITAETTHEFTPISDMDSPYEPIYLVPHRRSPDIIQIAREKTFEYAKYNGLKPPKPRRHTISDKGSSAPPCRINDVDPKPESLANTVRQLIHNYPEVSSTVPTTGPYPRTVLSVKSKPQAFSFGDLAEKYTRASNDSDNPIRTPSPTRQSSSRRYGPFTPSSTSSSRSPSTPTRAQGQDTSESPDRTPRQRASANSTGQESESLLVRYSSPMRRDSENQVVNPNSPKTPKPKPRSLGRGVFYGQPNSPLRFENSSVRPLKIALPPPPSFDSLVAHADAFYPPTPMGTKTKPPDLTSSIGSLFQPFLQKLESASCSKETDSPRYDGSQEVIVVTSPPDFSRQYKRVGSETLDREAKSHDITMSSWSEEDAEGEVDYELETSSPTPTSKGKFKARAEAALDDLDEGMWLSKTRRTVRPAADRDIDDFVESFKRVEDRQVYEYEEEAPLEMPPTPRPAHATLPNPGKLGKHINFPDKSTNGDDTPAFLTPFSERRSHPYDRSAVFVLAKTKQKSARLNRPPPGTIRPKRKRAQRETTNLCVFTLQKNFSKAIQDAHYSPQLQAKLLAPPGLDHDSSSDIPWWGESVAPPEDDMESEDSSDESQTDEYDEEDDEDEEVEDRGLWASQSYGVGLGLGLGFDLKGPSMPASSIRAERIVNSLSTSPPLDRTPSGKPVSRPKTATGLDALSPALDLADRITEGSLTPSPTSPDIITPEFSLDSGERTVLVKENYKERPGGGAGRYNGHWNLRLPVDEDDDDRPLWPRPPKMDKGKGRAIPEIAVDPPRPTTPETLNNVPPIVIPAHIPIDPSLSDEVNYNALAEAFGIDAEELAMQYMLEVSKLDTGKPAEEVDCADSPGASGSGLPPGHAWIEDVDMDVEMSDNGSRSSPCTRRSTPSSIAKSSSLGSDITSDVDAFTESFSSWCGAFKDEAATEAPTRPSSTPIRTKIQYGNEILNEISGLMDPLHIDDNAPEHDTSQNIDDTAPRMTEDADDDDDDNDHDYYDDTSNDNEGDYDDDDETKAVNGNVADDGDRPISDNDEEDPQRQNRDERIDKVHHTSNEQMITTQLPIPDFTFTPPSPRVEAVSTSPRFGQEGSFVTHEMTNRSLRVSESSPANSSQDSPTFFPLAPTPQQRGKSGKQFAKRMFTMWNSLKAGVRAMRQTPQGGIRQAEATTRPTKLRRIVPDGN